MATSASEEPSASASEEPSASEVRFIAFDEHKRYVVVGGRNARQEIVLPAQRVELAYVERWAKKNLRLSDVVVVEMGSSGWALHDLLKPLVARIVVANPLRVKLIARSMVRTDKKAVEILSLLLAANIVPEVWVPPAPVRQLRALIRHRQRLVSRRAAAKNRLHSLLQRHHIVPPDGTVFSISQFHWGRAWTCLAARS